MTELVSKLQTPQKLIKYLFTRGTSAFLIIFGRRNTGKTDFSLLISEIVNNHGIIKQFSTNIKIYNSQFDIMHITNLEDLTSWAKNTEGKKLFIFDEFGKAMRRRSPMSSLNIELIDNFQILRKYKLSIIAITINEKYCDNAALGDDVLDGVFVKPFYKNQKIAYYSDLLEFFSKTITNIPRTSIQFDTWDVAPFKKDSPVIKPKFKEEHLNVLWEWSHGKTARELGLSRMQIHRLSTKYVKEVLERESNK